jgi:hypothetical protein
MGINKIVMNKPAKEIITYTAVAAGAYFLVILPILRKLGIVSSAGASQTQQQNQDVLNAQIAAQYAKQKPFTPDATLLSFADGIYEALRYSSVSDSHETAIYYLGKVQNLSDVYRLIQLFGIREECYFGVLCHDADLPNFIHGNLSTSELDGINAIYYQRGINYKW